MTRGSVGAWSRVISPVMFTPGAHVETTKTLFLNMAATPIPYPFDDAAVSPHWPAPGTWSSG